MVNASPHVFGAEKSMAYLIGHLATAGFRFLLLSPGGETERFFRENAVSDAYEIPMLRLERCPMVLLGRMLHLLRSNIQALHRLRLIRPDVLHANGLQSLLQVFLPALLLRIPLVWHIRDLSHPRWIVRLCGMLARKILVPSKAAAEKYGWLGDKVCLVANPIFPAVPAQHRSTLDSAAVDNEAIRTLLDRNSGIFKIGLVGQIIPRKGHDLLLDALPGILDQVPQARVFFIGADLFKPDSRFEVSLQERLQASPGLRERVHFTGYLRNVEEVYGALDLLAIPSREETFGRVAIEAMAAGCLVVAARTGGLTEIIQSGRNGLLFDPENPSALAESIVELALNAGLRGDLIGKGYETAAQWVVVSGESAHRVEEVYRDLCRNQQQIGEKP